jgi:uroporphyrinogen decarboxylase
VNPRERTLAALRFEEVRPTPYTLWYDHETRERLTAHFGDASWERRIRNHVLRMTVNWEPKFPVDDVHYRDVHGTLWARGEAAHIVRPALTQPSLRGFDIPSYVPYLERAASEGADGRHSILPLLSWADTRRRLEAEGGEVLTVVGYGSGPFETAWFIRGYEDFFSDLLLEPAFAEGLLDLVFARHAELLGRLLTLPCDGIIFSDDYGDQRGVIIGPKLWRRFIQPRLARLYAQVHAAGKLAFQHSCGSVFDIVPDLIDAGLDVLQSLQPEAMPVYEIKKRWGRNLRLWGGLGTQHLLPFGTPDEVRAEVRRLRRELGQGGGYVFTSSKPIMKEVPLANALAMLEETVDGCD